MRLFVIAAVSSLVAATAVQAQDAGDPVAGAKVFRKCQACHVVNEEKNRVGPHLVGIIDRPIASVEGFNYSKAMTEYGEGGKVWDAETLTVYLHDPRGTVKGTKMAFAGLKKDDELVNVIAYLADPSAAE